jgi:glycosyltransferase involved in cell wall biosynthesis
MRVLLTTDNVGGVWTYALELAWALGQEGVDVALASMGTSLSSRQRLEVAGIPGMQVYESDFKLEWMDDPWDDLEKAGRWLLRINEEFQPDVVHLNSYVHATMTWGRPVLVVGHSCVLSWWQAVKNESAPLSWNAYRDQVTLGLNAADQVAAPSGAMRDQLDRFYGPLERSSVIYNARNPLLFKPRQKEPMIFSAGRLWDEAKNIAALERVAPKLSWPVYIAGDTQPPQGQSVEFGHVRLVGKLSVEQIAQWLGRSAVYVLPAKYEPFGLSILEAGLSGCTLVLGDIPSLREVWDDAALYVPPDDINALNDILQRLITDEQYRKTYADRALKRAREFTPNRMVKQYLAIYRNLIDEKQPATLARG